MKNLYLEIIKKLALLKESLISAVLSWSNSLKEDLSFYNSHTELLAIWTTLFAIITGLFIVSIKGSFLMMLMFLVLSIAVMSIGTIISVYYLYALKFHNKSGLLPRAHRLFNKSFKLRDLLNRIRISRVLVINNITKSFKLAS